MTLCLSEKPSTLAESNTAPISSPPQQSGDTSSCMHITSVQRYSGQGALNYRWGQWHWRQMPACHLGPPTTAKCNPQPLPIFPSNSLPWPQATGRPSLIRGADRPRPHPDPSSLEHVNLPVTHIGTHAHTHMLQTHLRRWGDGFTNHIYLRNGSH